MGTVNLIVTIILLGLGFISLISYFQGKEKIKKTQALILKDLCPISKLTTDELKKVNKLYKLDIEKDTPVYKLTGGVGYVVLENNGSGVKEWQIAGIMISQKSSMALTKKGVVLEYKVVDETMIIKKIDNINKRLTINKIDEEQAKKEVEQIINEYENNSIEFIITDSSNLKKPVHLLSYSDGKMEKPINLLD